MSYFLRIHEYIENCGNKAFKKLTSMLEAMSELFVKYHSIKFTLVFASIFTTFLFTYMYFKLSWIICKTFFIDYMVIMSILLVILFVASMFESICEYSEFEGRRPIGVENLGEDAFLEHWTEKKYYPFVGLKRTIFCSTGYNHPSRVGRNKMRRQVYFSL